MIHKICTTSANVEQFLDSVSNPDYSEDAFVLERTDTTLNTCVTSIMKFQRKLTMNTAQNHQLKQGLISHSQ